MPVEVILPRVDMDMTQGKISKWHVKEGDPVAKGGLIFEIETDKATMEVEAPDSGTIRNIAVAEGVTVPVGSIVAFIYGEGEAAAPEPKAEGAPVTTIASPVAAARSDLAVKSSIEIAPISGKPRATPLAKRLARQSKMVIEGIIGSGPNGRIVAEDVRRLLERVRLPQALAAIAPPDDAVAKLCEPGSFDRVPLDGMRRMIAQRLVQSKQTIPHFYLTVTCDIENLIAIREKLNDTAPRADDNTPLWKLSVNDFIIKAMALAIQRVPGANVTWTEAGLLRHRASDVGVVVAIEGGLFTPVIRRAEAKSLSQISVEMKGLAKRARAKKLSPAEYQGGTTAISNLGMYGIEEFAAIINPPHATILAVGAGIQRPTAVNGTVALRTQMICTLSCDHRAVDGALGAALLAAFKAFIEEPALMLA